MSLIEGLAILGVFIAIQAVITSLLIGIFRAELRPINEKLDNHITDTDTKIDALDAKVSKLLELLRGFTKS